jgi:hypothetical protein
MTVLARNLMQFLSLSSRDHFYCDTCAIIKQFPAKRFSTNAFSNNGGLPICVQVPLPQGYKLPFKPHQRFTTTVLSSAASADIGTITHQE